MDDPNINNMLKWSIENSDATLKDPNAPPPKAEFNPAVLQQLLGGPAPPSDAETMKKMMGRAHSSEYSLEEKRYAMEHFETLVQGIDNANNIAALSLWQPLVDLLEHEDAEMRSWAAWSVGTAVENNVTAQERLLAIGALPTLVKLANEDPDKTARKKAIRALSTGVRNFQPGLDAVVEHLPDSLRPKDKLDATDMSSVDSIIQPLRDNAQKM